VILEHGAALFGLSVESYDNPRVMSFQSTADLPLRSKLVRAVAPSADGGVYLLLDVSELYTVLMQRQRSGRPAGDNTQDKSRHVLIAEDAPIARELLSGILRSFGLKVSVAADGQRALDIMQVDRPDLVLTDIEMPLLDGLSLMEKMQGDSALARIPVIVLTTRTDDETQRRAANLGARSFISKQRFAEDEIRRAIEACLGRG